MEIVGLGEVQDGEVHQTPSTCLCMSAKAALVMGTDRTFPGAPPEIQKGRSMIQQHRGASSSELWGTVSFMQGGSWDCSSAAGCQQHFCWQIPNVTG